MSKVNPVQQQMVKLDEQWEEFASSKLSLFRWYFSADDIQLGLGFIKVKEQLDEKNPELFIHLHSEFEEGDAFGRALAEEMNNMIEDGIKDAKLEEEQKKDPASTIHRWQSPSLDDCTNGFNCIFRSCKFALDAFGDYVHNIVLVITPSRIKNSKKYTQWWAKCCEINSRYNWPENLKLVFFDTDKNSELAELARENQDHIYSADAPVDLSAAIQEILNGVDDGSPTAKFRQCTVDLQKAVGKQDKPAIEKLAAAAILIAEYHQWFDMWVVTLLTRAAGYLAFQEYENALKDYRAAQLIAVQGEQKNVPGCNKLQLQATVCEGTCLFSAGKFEDAANVYAKAGLLAESQQDLLMTLESWRMASFSMERANVPKIAWAHGIKALEAGDKMDEKARENSTLPFLGQALLRISPSGEVSQSIKQRFDELLGEDWLKRAEALAC
jgi:hypothetical protein